MTDLPLILIYGPSGAGKDTIVDALIGNYPELNLQRIPSHTGRPIRSGETNGYPYFFITDEEFKDLQKSGEILESNFYHGHYYGTSKKGLEICWEKGKIPIKTIEYHGVQACEKRYEDRVISYAIHVNRKALMARLKKRGFDAKTVDERLTIASDEAKYEHLANKVVQNNDGELDQAVATIAADLKTRLDRRLKNR